VYQAIERENLRTRKKHALDYVKTRLVALDFVIAHQQEEYLETEAQKVAFFEKELNVSRETLPVKQYRARRSAEVTPRYFVDRFPMFVNRLCSPPVVTFTYMDKGSVTLDGFGTHLEAYLGLFQAVRRFEFIYVAPTTRLFKAAESEFHRVLSGRRGQSQSASILEYFRLRKAWDSKERVASADVILLKEAEKCYASRVTSELYEKWRQGAVRDTDVMRSAQEPLEEERGVFRTLVCGSSLGIFADPRGTGAESWKDSDINEPRTQVSGYSSAQVSGA
jgi:hypothetical protein